MKYYIWGHCGTGKTTLAEKLSTQQQIPMLDLDSIAFKENWQFVGAESFIENVDQFIKHDSYVISGSWQNVLGDKVLDDADVIIILSLNYFTNMWAITKRTLMRVITQKEIHGGNKETFKTAFLSKDSMIYFCHQNYQKRQQDAINIQNKYPEKTIVLTNYKQYEQYLKRNNLPAN